MTKPRTVAISYTYLNKCKVKKKCTYLNGKCTCPLDVLQYFVPAVPFQKIS